MQKHSLKKPTFIRCSTLFMCVSILGLFANSNNGFFMAGGYIGFWLMTLSFAFELSLIKTFQNNKYCIIGLIFCISVLCAGLICLIKNNILELGQLVTFLVFSAAFIEIGIYPFRKSEVNAILLSCIISGLILSFLVITQRAIYHNDITRRSYAVFGHGMLDPNFLSSFIAFCSFISAHYFLKNKYNLFNVIAILIMVYAIFLTGSRAAFLYLGIGYLFALIEFIRINKQNAGRVFAILCFASIVLAIGGYAIYTRYSDSFARFFLNIRDYISDGSNQKRLHHWATALKAIFRAPLLGHGTTNEAIILNDTISDTSHNTFLSFYIRLGLIGLLSFLSIITNLMADARKKKNIFIWGMILGFILNIFIIPATMSYVTWIPLMVILIMLKFDT